MKCFFLFSLNDVAASKNSFGIDVFACKSPGTVLSLKLSWLLLLQLLTNMIDLGMSAHSATLSFFYRATSNPIPPEV
ncbi:hypothetical protein CAT7_06131 [Carnobacterium sp. AT7]|nr:hypothetical protein CAT7_06131 [Carnobacterium sp. AT7]